MSDLPGQGDVLRANVHNIHQAEGTLAFSMSCPQCLKALRITSKRARTMDAIAATKACDRCAAQWQIVSGYFWPAHDGQFASVRVIALQAPFGRRGPRPA